MAKYDLLRNVTVIAPNAAVPQGQIVKPYGPMNPNMPPQEQAFQVKVAGLGTVSATVQLLVTNDESDDPANLTWSPYGGAVAITGTNGASEAWAMTQGFSRYGATVTAISGTNASVDLKMSA